MIISEESEIFEEENENSKRTSVTGINEKLSDANENHFSLINEKIIGSETTLTIEGGCTQQKENNFNIFKIILNTENLTKQNVKLTEQFSEPFELNQIQIEDKNIKEIEQNTSFSNRKLPPQQSPTIYETLIQEEVISQQEKELLQVVKQEEQDLELEEQKRLLMESQNELYKLLFDKNEEKQQIKQPESPECPCRNSYKFFSFADQLPKPEPSSQTKDNNNNNNNNNANQQKQDNIPEQKETVKQQDQFHEDQDQQKYQLKISDLEASEETDEGHKTKKSEESEQHHLQSLLHTDIFGQSSQNLFDHSKNYEILTLSDCNSLVTKKCFSLFLSNQEQSILEEQENMIYNAYNECNDNSQNKKIVQLKVYNNEHNQKLKHKYKNVKFMNNQNLKLKCKLSLLPLIQKQKQQIEQTEEKQIQQSNNTKREELAVRKCEDSQINSKAKQQSIVSKNQLKNFSSSFKCMPKNYINFIESSIRTYDQKKTKIKSTKNQQNQSEIILFKNLETQKQNKQKIPRLKQSFNDKENHFLQNTIPNRLEKKLNNNVQN